MDQSVQPATMALYRRAPAMLLLAAATAVALIVLFKNTFLYLYDTWHREEYSHGFLIPLITGYLLWQRRALFEQIEFKSSWSGVVLAAVGVAVYFLGMIASITTVDTYALVIVLMGGALAVMGWRAFRIALVPLALLFLMNPIPNFFYYNLSAELQLISSQLGVAIIRLCGVSVFLEGNVIDLGTYKLQVAEACSGLRYLFPLMTLGVVVAYLFKGRTWMRWLLFLSTVPITVIMNSVRIGIIGVLVDQFGIAQAEGFLHAFEGWVVFMLCFLLLFAEIWLLVRLSGDHRPLRELFAFEPASMGVLSRPARRGEVGKPAVIILTILVLAVVPSRALPKRAELRPAREDFTEFPLQVGEWHGQRGQLDSVYIDTLKMDDYVLADYVRQGTGAVNFYVAYYASQRTGQSAHSPRGCLPGGGWRIEEFAPHEVAGITLNGAPLRVNRVIVQQGDNRQLVYYWFQERGRDITSEYLVKWYLFKDAIQLNRTDGALVRLMTPLQPADSPASGDARLAQFAGTMLPALQHYLPN
jgi:exosortase D (VPLPA-CTERM-specific)